MEEFNSDFRIVFQKSNYPVFQNKIYPDAQSAIGCTKGDLLIVEDLSTGLVFNKLFMPELLVYDGDYQNEQGLSPRFHSHLLEVVTIINRLFHGGSLVEIGCGKGYMLSLLQDSGFSVEGFDSAYEGTAENIYKKEFDGSLPRQVNGFVLRHVLEHIKDPYLFLRLISHANGGCGLIYIEVPCFDWICEKSAWFDLFYEHVNYFRLSDFYAMFGSVVESGRFFGGQYIYVVADLSTLRPPVYVIENRVSDSVDFSIKNIDVTNDKIIVWGGASKGVIFSLHWLRMGGREPLVVDINPGKQGGYMPGSGLRIYSPEEVLGDSDVNKIYVMNGNYLEEIKKMAGPKFNYFVLDDV